MCHFIAQFVIDENLLFIQLVFKELCNHRNQSLPDSVLSLHAVTLLGWQRWDSNQQVIVECLNDYSSWYELRNGGHVT